MTSKVKNHSKPSHDETVTKAVTEHPGATIEGVAQQAGIARSTAGKVLGRLTEAGTFTRHEGGRDGRKRLPNRFTLKDVELPAAYAKQVGDGESGKSAAKPASKPNGKQSTSRKAASGNASGAGKPSASDKPERLKAGGLEPLVLAYLKEHKGEAPHGPSQVAKALGRSSGAVGNCLARLADADKAKRVSDKPLRYDLAAA
jgi:hypothetical protein